MWGWSRTIRHSRKNRAGLGARTREDLDRRVLIGERALRLPNLAVGTRADGADEVERSKRPGSLRHRRDDWHHGSTEAVNGDARRAQGQRGRCEILARIAGTPADAS